jgi:hypothetical protein
MDCPAHLSSGLAFSMIETAEHARVSAAYLYYAYGTAQAGSD